MRRIDSTLERLALFSVQQTRAQEARAQADLPAHALMGRAGAAVARLAIALAPHARRAWIVAGPGNNGGDGFEAACELRARGREVRVLWLGDVARLPADARHALDRARAAGVTITADAPSLAATDIAVDALLGIGGTRPPEGRLAEAVRALNRLACPVLAVDVPSGLDADTGRRLGADAVTAQHTLTLLTAKPGLFTASGRDHAGTVWLDTLATDAPPDEPVAWLVGACAGSAAKPRAHAAHKGTFGDVAVVGGAAGMTGAAILAARAAHAAGAGRIYVSLLAPEAGAPDHDPVRPELMFRPGWALDRIDAIAQTTAVAGCGGGDAIRASLPPLLSASPRLVLDADALNAIAGDPGLFDALGRRSSRNLHTILTPHPLEAARLLGTTAAEVQSDRLRTAQALAARSASVVVLKGSGSVIAAPGRVPVICATGNASLASAGTGDVLAGWIAGTWAQGTASTDRATAAFEIAARAVIEHGAAADPRARAPLRAADLVEALHRQRAASR